MPETSAHHMIDIDKKLNELPPIPSERCIFRVLDRLRNENKKAYEPEVVAIGPYHHGKHELQPMEEHKLRCLKRLLNRRNETSVERYVVAMRESEIRARRFYADPISLDSNKFVEMMVLDSCFILELLRGDEMMAEPIEIAVCRDLVLFENQLPFFVVMQLFNMTKNSTDSLNNLVGMIARYFVGITPGRLLVAPPENPRVEDIEHLLGLLHYCCCYEFRSIKRQWNTVEIKDIYLKSTKVLQEAGIKFKRIEGRNLFDIRFVNETMEIPTLIIEDNTESFLRNLIAYEQYRPDSSSHHFTAYHAFMDNLVNTSKDVEILTRHGIIRNFLGENEVVEAMLNKLGNNITASYVGYEEVYNKVNEHCRRRWNVWLMILRRDLDIKPWAFLSFYYAVALLLLTVLQTIYSILSAQKSN